jgi:hypothetical protein
MPPLIVPPESTALILMDVSPFAAGWGVEH